jgi:solute carrier family 13 (sodium-dependent dicarboxylate transporter), member 2/3/5
MQGLLNFIKKNRPAAGLILAVLLALGMYVINPFGVDEKARRTLFAAVLIIGWWVFDAMPLAAVALVPLVLFPLIKIAPLDTVSLAYSDPMIFLFMGGFFIALALEKWQLHKRIALRIIQITGTHGNRIVLGFILATAFISMWISNTATTMMMFPIALSVIHVVNQQTGEGNRKNFSIALMLCIAYSSNIGGIATIIGTPPNVAYLKSLRDSLGYQVSFFNWMMICLPIALALLLILYWVLTRWLFKNGMKHNEDTRLFINKSLQELGQPSSAEKRVFIVFILTGLLWICKDLFIGNLGIKSGDADVIIALLGGLSLFIIPSGREAGEPLLEWKDTSRMAWGILLMFGGGLALAKALENAGLIKLLGAQLTSAGSLSLLTLILVITTISIFLSEVMSNLAQVIVLAPLINSLSVELGLNPLVLGVPMTLGASCAGMMPMGTPPNAIVFGSGEIKLSQMLRTGFVMNIVAVIIISLLSYWLVPVVVGK